MILTACCLYELLRCVLRLLFLEVNNSERCASGLDEGAAEFVAKAACCPGDEADLVRGGERRTGRTGRGLRTLLDMEKSGRVLTTRALAATALSLAAASEEFHRVCTVAGRGVRRAAREAAGRERARRAGAMGGGGMVGGCGGTGGSGSGYKSRERARWRNWSGGQTLARDWLRLETGGSCLCSQAKYIIVRRPRLAASPRAHWPPSPLGSPVRPPVPAFCGASLVPRRLSLASGPGLHSGRVIPVDIAPSVPHPDPADGRP